MNCVYCRNPRGDSKNCACKFCQGVHSDIWDSILDPGSIYRSTDNRRIVKEHPKLVDQYKAIVAWRPSAQKGLVVHGDTGLGKSRVMWVLLKRLHDEGVSVAAFDATGFADRVSVEFGAFNGPQWLETVCVPEVVYFDDIDKMIMTERVQSCLFSIIERRSSKGRKILITTNATSSEYEEKFKSTIGPALLRRIGEFCEPIFLEERK